DILNDLQGYPQRPARISSTTCEDILAKTFMYIDMLSTSATVNDMDKKNKSHILLGPDSLLLIYTI
ncbi:MAG: hypothetical protein IJ139_03275, partial [Bacteroidaceae bacterium]|nr:hypothetical protein [Bacteroidaceae bacterium]